jgi:hypothetical protein
VRVPSRIIVERVTYRTKNKTIGHTFVRAVGFYIECCDVRLNPNTFDTFVDCNRSRGLLSYQ